MVLVEGAANLMQRLARLSTFQDVSLLLRRKTSRLPCLIDTASMDNLSQMC